MDRDESGHEVPLELAGQHRAGDLESLARLEPGLHIRAQGVASERRAAERGAAVPGYVADEDRRLTAGQREHVVEVAARARSVGRPVGHRRLARRELLRHLRKQGGLEQPDLAEQLAPLRR